MLILPNILYAETHYSFRGIYSSLKKNEPEIVLDTPYRLNPSTKLPLLLLVKDSDLYPVVIKKIEVKIEQHDVIFFQKIIQLDKMYSGSKYISDVYYLDLPKDLYGHVKVNALIEVAIDDKSKIYHNDNYRISSHEPFQVYISKHELPATDKWVFGDLHYHSSYTEDYVEFGAPLLPTAELSRAMGLSFIAATDHSYDLDDYDDDYLKNDPELKKWHRFKQEVDNINENLDDFIILPGEEVSVGNSKNRNVHLLLLRNQEFAPGKGDSAEAWFRNKPDNSIEAVMNNLTDQVIAIAAHPEIPAPILEWLLIRRGKWENKDYSHKRLNGLQIWNGLHDLNFYKGLKKWTELLLMGRKLFIYAGNDAHGNFNRFRQIGFPFWSMRESPDQIVGKVRTGLRIDEALDLDTICDSILHGRCVITNGPFVDYIVINNKQQKAIMGDSLSGQSFKLHIMAKSSIEFGSLSSLAIFMGNINDKKEYKYREICDFQDEFNYSININIENVPERAYIRLELKSESEENNYFCYTNPVWLTKT